MLSMLAMAEPAPFYTSKKLGLLVRQPPGWLVQDAEALVLSEPGGTVRVRFEVLPGKNASDAWKKTRASLEKSHPGFEVVEVVVDSPNATLVQARFGDWSASYVLRPFGGGKLLLTSTEQKNGVSKKLTDWVTSVAESATPIR